MAPAGHRGGHARARDCGRDGTRRHGMDRPSHDSDKGAVTAMTTMPPEPGPPADPDVAAAVRLLHRRQGWRRTAVTSLIVFLLAYGGDANAQSQGAPAPSWFVDIVIA